MASVCNFHAALHPTLLYYELANHTEKKDLIFIGPNNLALALLEYTPAKYTEAVFLDAIEKVNKTAKKYGKKAIILAPDGESAKKGSSKL
jgi:2-keto-3-deoxy-L-rhamnonate aldolase RhmA